MSTGGKGQIGADLRGNVGRSGEETDRECRLTFRRLKLPKGEQWRI